MKRSHIHFTAKRDFIPLRIKAELVFILSIDEKKRSHISFCYKAGFQLLL